jgi:exopolyphosphatase
MYRVARRAAYSAQRRALATFVDARAANETYTYRTRGARFFARATTATTYYILGGLSVSGSLVAAEYMQLRGGSAPRLLARRQASSASAGGAPEPNVSSFLDREREALDAVIAGLTGASITRATGRVFLVIGNQASDADSIVSSLAVARALRAGPLLGLDVRPGDVVIPVVSMKRADWSMRPETHQLMAEAGLDSRVCSGERLVFTDDAADGELFASKTLATLAARDQLRIVLTDHNRSDCAALAPHTAHVAAIVDHHEDLGAHAAVKGGARVVSFDPTEGVQRGVGSACTLIAQLIAAQPGGAVLLSAHGGQLATLLTGVVLLDTVNMDPKMGKATAEDIAALGVLSAARRAAGVPDVDATGSLFDRLARAKTDAAFWQSLSVEQTLQYDLKQYNSARGECDESGALATPPPPYAIASALVSIDAIAEKCADRALTLHQAFSEFGARLDPAPAYVELACASPPLLPSPLSSPRASM